MLYLDAASDRMEQAHIRRVEEVRIATIFTQGKAGQTAYDKWHRRRAKRGRGLVGDALEAAVMGIAAVFPENVVRGTV